MQIENTLEEKAKFFVQYWGQKVFNDGYGEYLYRLSPVILEKVKSIEFLELTPISQISDEDAIEICRNCYKSLERDMISAGKNIAFNIHSEYSIHIGSVLLWLTDYLRSKGYALPWMGLSVEDQISYGWVKLKEDQPCK